MLVLSALIAGTTLLARKLHLGVKARRSARDGEQCRDHRQHQRGHT